MTVLIVEDDADMQALLTEWLKGFATATRAVSTLSEAFKVLRSPFTVDLMLLDLGLPDSEFQQTIASIPKMHALAPNLTIVAFTGRPVPDDTADGVIRKTDATDRESFLKAMRPVVCKLVSQKRGLKHNLAALESLTERICK